MFKKTPRADDGLAGLSVPKGSREPRGEFHAMQFAHTAHTARLLMLSVIANIALAACLVVQTSAFTPSTVLVDASSGKLIIPAKEDAFTSGGVSIDPLNVKALAKNFIEERYSYNPLTLEAHLAAALGMMAPESRTKEEEAIRTALIADYVVNNDANYHIALNESTWDIKPADKRLLTVSVSGTVTITNATVYRDRPYTKPVRFVLQIRKDAATATNLSGYVIVVPSKEIL